MKTITSKVFKRMRMHLKRKKGIRNIIDHMEISADDSVEEQIKTKHCDNVSLKRANLIVSF